MDLHTLPKTTEKGLKRAGRGHGSGRGGHTSGRGSKGQRSRSSVGLFFEGTKFKKSLIKRLPLFRGKGKLKAKKDNSLTVNIKFLNVFKKDEIVNLASLKEKGVIAKDLPEKTKIKILGDGDLGVALKVQLSVSKGAKSKIEKAGGEVILEKVKTVSETPVEKKVEKVTLKIEKPKKTIKKETVKKETKKEN